MKDYLVVLGTNSIDEYYEMSDIPVMGEKVICKYMSDQIGGMLANAASVYAGYGSKTYMIDFVNNGKNAQKIVNDMKKCNVDASYFTHDDSISDSKCFIMLKHGERVIFVFPNNKKELHLTNEQIDLIVNSSFVYSTTTELRSFHDTRRLVDIIRSSGSRLAIDVEPGTLTCKDEDWEILRKSKILFVNTGGGKRLSELYGGSYIETLNSYGVVIVRTCGSNGCEVYAPNKNPIKISGHKVPVVDTTGAGDTFNASFVYGFKNGWTIERCAQFANAAAARAVGFFGPRGGIADEQTIWDFLKNEGSN